MKTNKPELPISTYEDVAAEYYDPVRHPTCANFSQLSSAFLDPRIRRYVSADANTLEVGVGRSTVAPILQELRLPLDRLTLLDQSAGMLAYSRDWEHGGARLLVRDACRTQLPERSFRLIVSSLGDPYNCRAFWWEVFRLLEPGGVCLFTTPAPEWAARFRAKPAEAYAEFVIADGSSVLVPSKIPPLDQQIRLIDEAGLHVVDIEGLSAERLSGAQSPKLLLNQKTMRLSIVRGFAARQL